MPAVRERLKHFAERTNPFWRRLLDPLDTVFDPAQRRQARLLNYLLIPVFASLAFLMLWNGRENGALLVAVDFLVLVIIFLLNRIGMYGAAALALSLLISAAALTNTFVRASLNNMFAPSATMMWIAPALVVAYLLLPLRGVALVVIFNLIGVLVVPMVGDVSFYAILPAFYFTVVTSLLIVMAAMWRSRSVALLEQQSQALSESEDRYRSLIEASFETIVVHKDGTIIDVNPAVERLIGYKPEEIIGRKTFEFVDPVSRPVVDAVAAVNSEEVYEARLRHKNGMVLNAELRGKLQVYRGEMVRVVTVRDITEQKREEDLTIEREKVRALQKFIGDLSHDLRTPLSVINTSIYLIERLAKEPKRQQHHIDVLQEQAKHMQRLLEDLISMARLDKADTGDFRYQWTNVNEPVAQAVQDQQNRALRKSQTLGCRLGSDLPHVLIDAEQFKLALNHLILNGLSYTSENGTVMVETLARDGYVVVEVRDNGVGIEPDDMPHIFEQFYRADRARGEEGGTGVGLPIAKKIVEAHNGKIQAESIPGHGSVFRILLPVVP